MTSMEPEKADSTPRAHRLTPRTSRGRKSTNSEPPRPSSPSPSPPAGREIRLLRVRLEELRLRLGTAADEKENRAPTPERLRSLHAELRAVCEALLERAGRMYAAERAVELRAENGALRAKLAAVDARIADVLGENALLRWEHERDAAALEAERRRVDERALALRELQAEARCLRDHQAELERLHAAKLQDEVAAARADEQRAAERRVHELEARLREEQRARRRAEDECAALRARDAAPQTLERLAEDNRALYRKLIDARRQVQEQVNVFYERSTDSEEPSAAAAPPKPAVRFGAVERISADGRVDRRALPDRELGVLRRELEAERQQRRDVTRLLLQMSRDLKTLFHKQEE